MLSELEIALDVVLEEVLRLLLLVIFLHFDFAGRPVDVVVSMLAFASASRDFDV